MTLCADVIAHIRRAMLVRGDTLAQAAQYVVGRYPTTCRLAHHELGSYPSSEPELRAMQRARDEARKGL